MITREVLTEKESLQMESIKKFGKVEYQNVVVCNGKKYVRDECIMGIDNFHTISWNFYPDQYRTSGPLHYYSYPQGWSNKEGWLCIDAPAPELEKIFQRKIKVENLKH